MTVLLPSELPNMRLGEKVILAPLMPLQGSPMGGVELTLIKQSDNGRVALFDVRWLGVKIGQAQATMSRSHYSLQWYWEKMK